MKYIDKYKVFEGEDIIDMSYDDIMGRILHLYSSIPLTKQKSEIVIKKILYPNYPKLGEEVNLTYQTPHDKARFVDYFNSLLKSKDTRGDNFEGFISGLYNGDLSSPYAKYDVIIDDKTWSVKFTDNQSKAPELGSFQKLIKENNLDVYFNLGTDAKSSYGLREIFKGDNIDLKENLWTNVISKDITGGWIIAYPIETKNNLYIRINVIELYTMKELLMNGGTTSPKGGFKSIYSLSINPLFRIFKSDEYSTKSYDIIIPKLTIDDLRKIYINDIERNWSSDVFGRKYSSKIRPDVLRYIKNNSKEIAYKLLKYKDF